MDEGNSPQEDVEYSEYSVTRGGDQAPLFYIKAENENEAARQLAIAGDRLGFMTHRLQLEEMV